MSDAAIDTELLLSRLAHLEAKEAIRDVLYRYARGADRCDVELFKSCYWPDAVDAHWFYNGNAHEFCDFVIPLLAEITHSQHSITNPIIDIDGDRAFVECQWDVLHRIPLEEGRVVDQRCEGRYLDIFERRDGEWKILRRQTAIEGFREHVTVELFADRGDGVGARAPDDVVYLGHGLLDADFVPYDGAGLHLWTDARQRHAG